MCVLDSCEEKLDPESFKEQVTFKEVTDNWEGAAPVVCGRVNVRAGRRVGEGIPEKGNCKQPMRRHSG